MASDAGSLLGQLLGAALGGGSVRGAGAGPAAGGAGGSPLEQILQSALGNPSLTSAQVGDVRTLMEGSGAVARVEADGAEEAVLAVGFQPLGRLRVLLRSEAP